MLIPDFFSPCASGVLASCHCLYSLGKNCKKFVRLHILILLKTVIFSTTEYLKVDKCRPHESKTFFLTLSTPYLYQKKGINAFGVGCLSNVSMETPLRNSHTFCHITTLQNILSHNCFDGVELQSPQPSWCTNMKEYKKKNSTDCAPHIKRMSVQLLSKCELVTDVPKPHYFKLFHSKNVYSKSI